MQYYYLVLALHLISILIWISALTYLSRLMIIHTKVLKIEIFNYVKVLKKKKNLSTTT